VLSLERKKELYAVCTKYDVIIIEDEPYWYLQFPSAATREAESRGHDTPRSGPPYKPTSSSRYPFLDSLLPSFTTIDIDGRVIRLDTFSKTVAPGCRLGWVTAQPAIIERYVRISETSTQQPSGFVQSLVAELVIGPQPEAKAAFARATLKGTGQEFSGWQMDGWVRWLEGLRGSYERRMIRMCQLIDSGTYEIKTGSFIRPSAAVDEDWGIVTKTKLISYEWPRGGMFVWLRVHFETHPLWNSKSSTGGAIDGLTLSTALMMYLTVKPYLVLVASGAMFSATPQIRVENGWAYYRLCFAAETDENIDSSSQRFVEGVQKFWRVKSVQEIEKLVDSFPHVSSMESLAESMGQMGTWLGC